MDAQQYMKKLESPGQPCDSCETELRIGLFEAAKPLLLSEGDLRFSKGDLLLRITYLTTEMGRTIRGAELLDKIGIEGARPGLQKASRQELLDFLRGMVMGIAADPCHRIDSIEQLFRFDPPLLRDFRVMFLITAFRPEGWEMTESMESASWALRDARAAPLLLKLLSAMENAGKNRSLNYGRFLSLLGTTGTDEAVAKLDQLLQGEKGDVLERSGSIGWGGGHPMTLKGVLIQALGNSENKLAVAALERKLEKETNHAAREELQFQLGRLSIVLRNNELRMPEPPQRPAAGRTVRAGRI